MKFKTLVFTSIVLSASALAFADPTLDATGGGSTGAVQQNTSVSALAALTAAVPTNAGIVFATLSDTTNIPKGATVVTFEAADQITSEAFAERLLRQRILITHNNLSAVNSINAEILTLENEIKAGTLPTVSAEATLQGLGVTVDPSVKEFINKKTNGSQAKSNQLRWTAELAFFRIIKSELGAAKPIPIYFQIANGSTEKFSVFSATGFSKFPPLKPAEKAKAWKKASAEVDKLMGKKLAV